MAYFKKRRKKMVQLPLYGFGGSYGVKKPS